MDEKYISADELAIQLSVTGPTIRKWFLMAHCHLLRT
jgi:hypothetical protein